MCNGKLGISYLWWVSEDEESCDFEMDQEEEKQEARQGNVTVKMTVNSY